MNLRKDVEINTTIPTKVWYNALLGGLRGTSNNAHCLPRSYNSTIESVDHSEDVATFE